MDNYKFYIYGKTGCKYFDNSVNLLQSLNNKKIISKNDINELKPQIYQDFNLDDILVNINAFNKHNTSPLIFYGNNEKLLFIGGNDKLVDLIYTIENNNKNIINKIYELYGGGNDIITSLIYILYEIN